MYVDIEYCTKVLHTGFVQQNTKLVIILIKNKKDKMKPWILLNHSCQSLSPVSVAWSG